MASFRRTRRQVLGHHLYLGALAGSGLAIAVGLWLLVRRIGGDTDPRGYLAGWLVAALLPVAVALVTAVAGRRTGVDADDAGLRRVPAAADGYWPWPRVVDIRAQRRGARTVIAIDLDSGVVLRLPAPYHGRLLGADPEFEHKYFTLRNLWETHRRASARPPA
ncbi:MAG TPA: hypothetical protein VJT31_01745 [Rugosimonospora sp.]|nr:hypothetical protein [Rugosimonospora sp.]